MIRDSVLSPTVAEVLDLGIRPRKDQTFVSRVGPTDEERRPAIIPTHFEDLCVASRLSHVHAVHDQPVTHGRLQASRHPNHAPSGRWTGTLTTLDSSLATGTLTSRTPSL